MQFPTAQLHKRQDFLSVTITLNPALFLEGGFFIYVKIQLMKIISWNVNGIRAWYKKGCWEFIEKESPDFFCVQEGSVGRLPVLEKKTAVFLYQGAMMA